jgi:transcriptional regulator NrdR family protein
MIKCPKCGSTAQIEVFEEEYHEDGWEIIAVRWYSCGCGRKFTTLTTYHSNGDEEIDNPCV